MKKAIRDGLRELDQFAAMKTAAAQPISPSRRRDQLNRPPSFLSAKSLAMELDVSEREVFKLVERGVLPKPTMLDGIPRFEWELVRMAISATVGGVLISSDPYMAGVKNATSTR